MVGKVIYNLLANSSELTTLIGNKIFPLISDDEEMINYIVYERRSTQPTNTKLKRSTVDVLTYDIMIFADTLQILNDIGLAVRNTLDQYKGVNSGVWIDNIVYQGENDDYEDGSKIYGKFMQFDVRYNNLYSTLAQPTNLTAVGDSDSITLTWTDNATDETGYKIYRGTNLDAYSLLDTIAASSTTYDDTTAVADTMYYYFVVAYNSVGNGYASKVVGQKIGGACASATVTVNSGAFNTVASGGTLDVPVVNSDDSPIGTISGGKVVIGNSEISINSTLLQSVLATETQNINVTDTDFNEVGGANSGSWIIDDSSITVNGDAFGSVLAEGTLDVPVEYANGTPVGTITGGIVEIPNPITPSGIAYSRPALTGQTTIYRTGDDAWRVANMPYADAPTNPTHIATLVDFFTLADNNAFGNTLRFTDQSGAAAVDAGGLVITTDTLIDHYTGLEHAVTNAETGNNKSWNTAIDECLALNIHGFDDWYLPNAFEELSVAYLKGKSDSLTLIVGVGARSFWTSTTQFDDTTRALRYNNTTSANLILQGQTKTTTLNYIPVRQRY